MSFNIAKIFLFLSCHLIFFPDSNAQQTKNESVPSDPESLLPKECGLSNFRRQKRIVGGEVTKKKEFPWMARLGYVTQDNKQEIMAGASLITDRYVLTAAHTVEDPDLQPKTIMLCEWDRSSEKDCVIRNNNGRRKSGNVIVNIEEIIVHPDYDTAYAHNDIALIRLADKVEFNNYIRPICLPTDASLADLFTAIGWGREGPFSPLATYLMKANYLPRVDHDECRSVYSEKHNISSDSQICAGDEDGTCTGDSGGPLMQKDEKNRWVIVGITSYGKLCGIGYPSIYTKVFYFRDWILSNLRE